jgi:hypothetical protein
VKLWQVVKLYSESKKAPSLPAKLDDFHNRGCEKAQILQILGVQDSCRLHCAISQSSSLTTAWQYLLDYELYRVMAWFPKELDLLSDSQKIIVEFYG